MSVFNYNGKYESHHRVTVINGNGTYDESKFKSESEERDFFRFLNLETKRIYYLKLPENDGKSIDAIKNEVYFRHFPRWGQE